MARAALGSLLGGHAVYPGIVPIGYFDDENISFIQKTIHDKLKSEFGWGVVISKADIVRVLDRVMDERYETIPRMNQRALMYILNEYRVHQLDKVKHLRWEEGYYWSQQLYDPISRGARYDPSMIKTPNRFGIPKIGGTLRFRPVN